MKIYLVDTSDPTISAAIFECNQEGVSEAVREYLYKDEQIGGETIPEAEVLIEGFFNANEFDEYTVTMVADQADLFTPGSQWCIDLLPKQGKDEYIYDVCRDVFIPIALWDYFSQNYLIIKDKLT